MKHLLIAFFFAFLGACGADLHESASQSKEWQQRDEQRGVNMDAYCKRKYGTDFKAHLNGTTTGDWACARNQNDQRPISVVEACQWQQNTSRVGVRNPNDPLSWYCLVSVSVWVPVRVGVNLETYCQRKFGAPFHAKLFGTTVGDWSCAANQNDRRPVNVKEACQQQQNTSTVGYRNVNDPYSWYCEK